MNESNAIHRGGRRRGDEAPRARSWSSLAGFTLIELLTVISIIGVLAGLVVGLAPLASRKMKEARMRSELNQLVSLIGDYKSELGYYPPDNPSTNRNAKWRNPLYYELCGAVFTQGRTFKPLSGDLEVPTPSLQMAFGVSGIANSKREQDIRQVAFSHTFKPSQHKEVTLSGRRLELLVAPLPGPKLAEIPQPDVNPWYYDASSPHRNNATSFDLWADIKIGKTIYRFSNWSRDPIPLN